MSKIPQVVELLVCIVFLVVCTIFSAVASTVCMAWMMRLLGYTVQ